MGAGRRAVGVWRWSVREGGTSSRRWSWILDTVSRSQTRPYNHCITVVNNRRIPPSTWPGKTAGWGGGSSSDPPTVHTWCRITDPWRWHMEVTRFLHGGQTYSEQRTLCRCDRDQLFFWSIKIVAYCWRSDRDQKLIEASPSLPASRVTKRVVIHVIIWIMRVATIKWQTRAAYGC